MSYLPRVLREIKRKNVLPIWSQREKKANISKITPVVIIDKGGNQTISSFTAEH